VSALIGILLIGFGIILFVRTIGRILHERRRRATRFDEALRGPTVPIPSHYQPPPVPTVMPGQTGEWAAYIPRATVEGDSLVVEPGALAYTVDDGRHWRYGDDGWTEVLPDATPTQG